MPDPNVDLSQSGVETWSLRKPAVVSDGGLIASQHYAASEAGAEVLRRGGNAVDAAVAAGLMIGTVEPWMSGLGGGGQMLIYSADQGSVQALDFGMRSPGELDPDDYPLAGAGSGADLFAWPAVVEDRNLRGYLSIAVPGFVAGMSRALAEFGSGNLSWSEALAPAVESAERGFAVDWYATLKIAAAARDLSDFKESRRVYLADGFAPAGEWSGPLPQIKLGRLAATLRRLAEAGADDFYRGELARALVADARAGGGRLSAADLADYRTRVTPAGRIDYRDAEVFFAPGLTAGPSLAAALRLLDERLRPAPGGVPDAAAYGVYAQTLFEVYAERLATLGDAGPAPSCTTHISVLDRSGNMVALTQTLLSVFGSKVMLPQTGVLMNNGIMWFDPRPGRPNSIAAGKRPLSNMCPTLAVAGSQGWRVALGASGGRRIMPAVLQLVSFLLDYRMGLDAAIHQPRLDVSGGDRVTLDAALAPAVRSELGRRFSCQTAPHGVYPALFACPNAVAYNLPAPRHSGVAFVPSPWAQVGVAD